MASTSTKPSHSHPPRRKNSHHISKPPSSRKPTVNPYPRIGMPQPLSAALPCYELTPIMDEYMETMKEFSSGCPQINVLDPSSPFFAEWRHMSEFKEDVSAGEVVKQLEATQLGLGDIDVWQYIEPDAEALA